MPETENPALTENGNNSTPAQALLLELSHEYFAHPLTVERFDRTSEQRLERTEILANLLNNTSLSYTEAQAEANRQMFARFGEQITELVAAKAARISSVEIQGDYTTSWFTDLARTGVDVDLKELNRVMPLHGLERLARPRVEL